MHMQLDISLGRKLLTRFPDGKPSETHFRKLLAFLNTKYEIGLPPWAFGYGDDNTALSDRFPCISFGLNRESLRITGIGLNACDLLTQKGWLIQSAMIRELQDPVQMSVRTGEHAFSYSPSPIRYFFRRLCVGKTTPDSFWWREAKENNGRWSDRSKVRLQHLIGNALYDQTCYLLAEGDTVDGDIGEWLESMMGTENAMLNKTLRHEFKMRMGIEVKDIDSFTAVRSTGSQGLRVLLKDVDFTARAQIEGLWWAGRARIEGAGVLRRSTGASKQASEGLELVDEA